MYNNPQNNRNSRPDNRSTNLHTGITSPYNFVPLSNKVFTPSWGKERGTDFHALSHDVPLQDGLSGCLEITLRNDTPLLIANDPNGQGEKVPLQQGKKFVIPGSSIRGMLRGVIEIATYGKLGPGMEDRQLFARDLTNGAHWYRDQMIGSQGSDGTKSKPGWMKRMKSVKTGSFVYVIEPARMERIPKGEARDLLGSDPIGTEVVYENDGEDFVVVFTGDVPKKTREFGFSSTSSGKPMLVSPELFQHFVAAHVYNKAWWVQDGKCNTPGHLQVKLRKGERIPVFYTLGTDKKLNAIGLAYMFRVPYKHTLSAALKHTSEEHQANGRDFDLAQSLFGALPDADPDVGLRSRVSFSALFSSNGAVQPTADKLILSSPKSSYYPAYIKQDGLDLKSLQSDMPELAGWKRYQVRSSTDIYQTGDGTNDAVASKLRPLKPGALFTGRVRFHNLRAAELGALVWAISWGGDEQLRHSLGMGKPYGYGSVALQITGAEVIHNTQSSEDFSVAGNSGVAMDGLRFATEALATLLRSKGINWPDTPELKELRAMANPVVGDQAARAQMLRYPQLNGKGFNEFKNNKNLKARLPKASSWIPPEQRGNATPSPGNSKR